MHVMSAGSGGDYCIVGIGFCGRRGLGDSGIEGRGISGIEKGEGRGVVMGEVREGSWRRVCSVMYARHDVAGALTSSSQIGHKNEQPRTKEEQ